MSDEAESIEYKAARYERALKAIKDCTLEPIDFGDWVQAVCEDVLNGLEPECYQCGTSIHEGPCVDENEEVKPDE